MTMRRLCLLIIALAASSVLVSTVHAIDEEHRTTAITVIDKGIEYLKAHQDAKTGGWSVPETDGQPHLPAITALVLNGLPEDVLDEPFAQRGVAYLLDMQRSDGGIYDTILPSYNTSISMSALSRFDDDPSVRDAIEAAKIFLKSIQWSESADPTRGGKEAADPVEEDHPYYGGFGYGKHGRPDMSNLNIALQGMHDAGVSPDDASVQRALKFLERCQMLDTVNDMPYAKGSKQGGFIYATTPNAATLSVDGGVGQSQAGTIEETMDDGTVVSRLRAYGSVTYAGFRSYLYANLERDDPRVVAAFDWIRANYTLDENPGMGPQGLYYYYVTMARALDAWGEQHVDTKGASRNWANDLIDKLASLQGDDGAFAVKSDRWMEDDPVLITAYALIALRYATDG